MSARAVVRAAHGDGSVDLEFEPVPGCAGCSGVCLWRRLRATRLARIPAPDTLTAGVTVSVSLAERDLLRGAAIAHGLPWLALLAGAAIGASLFDSDLAAFTGAGLGLVASGLLLPSIRRRIERATLAGLRIELAE
jgi:positive regulator of sigma E activity